MIRSCRRISRAVDRVAKEPVETAILSAIETGRVFKANRPGREKGLGRNLRGLASLLVLFGWCQAKAEKPVVWEPVPPEDLAAVARTVEGKTIDSEVLRSRIELWADNKKTTQENFRRVK